MPDAFDHCEELVREGDKDRFLATLFAPQKYRRALYALYAFNLEMARVRELAREPMPGELRLQWWREAEMDREAPNAPSPRWLELDWQFHQTIVEASGNERFVNDFDLLMIECNYVFYRLPDTAIRAKSSENPLLSTLVHGVVDAHRQIVRLIETRDTNGVVDAMRLHLAGLSNRVHRDVVKSQLAKERSGKT
jgi:DNA-binding GntR family transcriptional regulator